MQGPGDRIASPVGRDDEIARLLAALEDACSAAVVVAVSGEAGIGKSMLLDVLGEHAAAAGDQVLRGACSVVLSEPLPYAPIAAALRSSGISNSGLSTTSRGELFESILSVLVEQRPPAARQVLILEDLHWGDAGSIEIAGFLARNLPAGHLLVLTRRSDEAAVDPAAAALLDAVTSQRQVRRITLSRLSQEHVAALFIACADRPPVAAELSTLMRMSGGNPFIAAELVEAGSLDQLPSRLQDLLMLRMGHLDVEARAVVHALAVLGRPAEQQLLDDVVGLPGQHALVAVGRCVAAGALIADPHGVGYAFRHALMQEAVLRTLLPGERQQIHHRVASALDGQRRTRHSASAAAEWAAHWRASGQDDRAFEATVIAAETASRVFARTEAWRQYQHLVVLLDAGCGGDDERRCRVLAAAAEAARWAGDTTQAVALARRAADLAVEPELRARIAERLGRSLWDSGDTAGAERAYALAEVVAAELPRSTLHATIGASTARLTIQAGRYEQAEVAARSAITVAAETGARADQGRATAVLGMCRVLAGDLEAGVDRLRHAAVLTERWGDDDDRRRVASNLAFALLIAGHTAEACDTAVRALSEARRHNAMAGTGAALVSNTIVLLRLTGRWDEAARLSDDAFAEGITEGQALLIRLARAELDMVRGDLAGARENLDTVEELVGRGGTVSITADLALAEAMWCLLSGDPDSASAAVERATDALTEGSETRDLARACALGLRIEVDLPGRPGRRDAVGPTDRAHFLRDSAQSILATTPSPEVQAYCVTALAEYLRARGSPVAAGWLDAAERWSALCCPHERAYCCFRAAEAYLATDRSAAALQIRTAASIATTLGAAPLTSMIDDLVRRGRLRPTPARASSGGDEARVSPPVRFGLTRREGQVLDELVLGLTNKQIAARLYLSPRTVDVHVANVLMKMGVRTRAEAVVLSRDAGASTPVIPAG